MTTTVATDYDNIEIQQQYSDVNNRWDVDDWDNENSSARLFERSRIKALAGKHCSHEVLMLCVCDSVRYCPSAPCGDEVFLRSCGLPEFHPLTSVGPDGLVLLCRTCSDLMFCKPSCAQIRYETLL